MLTSRPDPISIRALAEEELSLVRDMASRVFFETYLPILPKEQIDYMFPMMYALPKLQSQYRAGDKFLAAFEAGVPVGYAAYRVDAGNTFFIDKVYVLTAAQGRGLGKQFIDCMAELARKAGAVKLQLRVNRFNPAVRFYERLGFHKAGAAATDIGGGYVMDDYFMERIP